MKIGKAITAMQRGEVVRRRGQSGGFRISDGALEHQSTDKAWSRSGPYFFDNNLKYDDWVIVRKKKKPQFTEDQLEPVGTEAVVGDVIVAMEDKADDIGPARRGDLFDYAGNGRIDSRRSFGSPELSAGWSFSKDEPSLRILKRPLPPLRNVFADPRVGDVVKHLGDNSMLEFGNDEMNGATWTILAVLPEFVIVRSADGVWTDAIDRGRRGWAPDSFTVVSRAPEEVAPK